MPTEKLCDLTYLSQMMGGKPTVILQMIDAFLGQVPDELRCINQAVEEADLPTIKSYAHTMRSSISIMGISVLIPVLQEMEDLSAAGGNASRMAELNDTLNTLCIRALTEMEQQKLNYI